MKLTLSTSRPRFPQCTLNGCSDRRYFDGLCRRHYLNRDRLTEYAVRPTGAERRAELQLTDGEQYWWVSKPRWFRGQENVGRIVTLTHAEWSAA